MKKSIITSAIALIITGSALAQPVSDRAVIPIGVTLTQILRIHVTNGGNIEFVFNDIDDFKNGIANSNGNGFYDSDVEIASSTEWELDMGTEDADFVGTDDPGNLMTIDNVGFACDWTGNNICCNAVGDDVSRTGAYTNNTSIAGVGTTLNGLLQYTGQGTCVLFTSGSAGNGGDINDNAFTINWEAGTGCATCVSDYVQAGGTSPANNTSLLDQNLSPDRYVTNVFLELTSL